MRRKRLLNYEFLRDNVMCITELDKQTAQQIKSLLLMACYDLSYLEFCDARFFVNTRSGDKVTIILGLISDEHSTQVHYEVSTDTHCINANIKRKFGVFELNKNNGAWTPVGVAELNDDAGALISLIIKNVPKEFILTEPAEDLPIIVDKKPLNPDGIDKLKGEITSLIDDKIEYAAGRIQDWISEEFCPVIQEWLEKALGRKLDVKLDVSMHDEPNNDPESPEEPEKNKSNFV